MSLDLSIIIVNHNTKALLEDCLNSLLAAMPPIRHEVLVVNNTPSDGSSQLIAEKFPQVLVIENREPRGFAENNNLGMTCTIGNFIWLLNPDTLVFPEACQVLMSFLATHSRAGMVGPRYLNPDNSIQPLSCCRFPSLGTDVLQDLFLSQLFPRSSRLAGPLYPQVWQDKPFQVDTLVGASILARRQVVQDVGYLDEQFFMFLEETDWCLRVRRAGWEIWHVPQARIVHIGGASAGGNMGYHKVLFARSRQQFYLKHYGRGKAILARGSMLFGLSLRIIAWAVIGLAIRSHREQASQKLSQWIPPLQWLLTSESRYMSK